jgi:deoxyadenosine/deoxycytidine kinase
MTLVIGIAGRMRTGKSSLAEYLEHYLEQTHTTMTFSFAEAVRQEAAMALWQHHGYAEARYMLSRHESEHKESVRPLLQALGQAKRQMVDDDYWIVEMKNAIHRQRETSIAIIDDVRHHNEADFCIENGILIRLRAPERTLIERGANPERLAHYSENAMQYPSPQELHAPHRVLTLDTAGLSPKGMFKALRPFIDELIEGEFE